jgi:uncharacterized membrane protein YraQ (UPF0718 family)
MTLGLILRIQEVGNDMKVTHITKISIFEDVICYLSLSLFLSMLIHVYISSRRVVWLSAKGRVLSAGCTMRSEKCSMLGAEC